MSSLRVTFGPVLLLAAGLVLLVSSARLFAAEPKESEPDRMAEAIGQFDAFCLQRFPDLDAMQTLATARGAEVRSLKGLPSTAKVWAVREPSGLTLITAIPGPKPGCGVRRLTPLGVLNANPLIKVLNMFGRARHWGFTTTEPDTDAHKVIAKLGIAAVDATGKPAELFMLFTTDYGYAPPPELQDAATDAFPGEIYINRGGSTLPKAHQGDP